MTQVSRIVVIHLYAELPNVGPITHQDIEVALKNSRPSAHLHAHRYEKFNEDYGSHILQ